MPTASRQAAAAALDEGPLLRRARSASRAERDGAFEELYQQLGRGLELVCRRMLGQSADAEDALQETLLAIHQALPGFRAESRLSTWAYRITVRTCLQRRARSQARRAQALEHEPEARAESSDRAELSAALDRAVAALRAEYRAVFSLCCVEELSCQDVAAILGIPEGTVWTRLHRARKELAERLERVLPRE